MTSEEWRVQQNQQKCSSVEVMTLLVIWNSSHCFFELRGKNFLLNNRLKYHFLPARSQKLPIAHFLESFSEMIGNSHSCNFWLCEYCTHIWRITKIGLFQTWASCIFLVDVYRNNELVDRYAPALHMREGRPFFARFDWLFIFVILYVLSKKWK